MNALSARTVRERWQVAVVGAILTGALAVAREAIAPGFPSDLDQLWHAAQALTAGQDPYGVVGPGRKFDWPWPVFYPLPAILLVVPLSPFPIHVAHIAFGILAGAALGFAIGSRWRVMWPLLLSEAYFLAVSRNQWSPFLLAAIWLPAAGFIVAAKPNIGVIVVAGQKRDAVVRVVCLAGALVALAFITRPSWLGEWLSLARSAPNKEIAILQPGGFLLLGALKLWRSTDGRILLAMAVIPQTPSVYDLLLLFAVCRTTRQALLLATLTHALQWSALSLGPYPDFDAYYRTLAKLTVWLIHIPVMAIALSNHGTFQGRATTVAHARVRSWAVRATKRIDAMLLFVLAFMFSLQLWVLEVQ